ncbi:Bug family tripartite tricarboxylate transporter substrate binding protein [Muricoccus radiodurans]|uniref:Bug family tripartite tricarboxylate transporter substrate binding protein n=1 Tax=Muricoccus radiodurans TaxID=2231721 RepID=UPI003CE99C7C
MHRRTALVLSLAAPSVVRAQGAGYPNRPVRMIVPFAAGTTADAILRMVAAPLGAALGQPFIIENRGGANGTVGLSQALRAPPDGYVLGQGTNSNTAAALYLMRNLPYDPLRDLAIVGGLYVVPTVLIVAPSFPADDVAGFLTTVRAAPGRYAYGHPHATGAAAGASVSAVAGLDMTSVSYASGPQMLNDLLGGQLQVVFTDISSTLPLLRAGRVKVLAISSAARSPVLPDVPTLRELLPRPVEFVGWGGMVAPAGTPRPVLLRLNEEVNRILATPELAAFLRGIGAESLAGPPQAFEGLMRQQIPLWAEALRAARVEPE